MTRQLPVRSTWAVVLALAALTWLCWNVRLGLLWRCNQLPAYDFGIFTQISWALTHGAGGRLSLLNGVHWLGDHFQPIVALAAPAAGLFGPYGLVLVETTAVLAGVVPLTRIALRHASPTIAVALAGAWLLNPGTWYAVLFPVHPTTLIAPLLVALLDAADRRRWGWVAFWALLAMLCKEDAGFFLAGIGLWLAVVNPGLFCGGLGVSTSAGSARAAGAALAVGGLAVGLLCVFGVVPAFRGSASHMFELAPALRDGGWADPRRVLAVAVDSPEKIRLILTSLCAFAFLPLLDPLALALAPFFAERLLGSNPNHALATFHYGGPAVAILAVAAARASGRLRRVIQVHAVSRRLDLFVLALIAMGLTGSHLVLKDTGGRTDKPPSTWELVQQVTRGDPASVDAAVAMIPAGASVLAQDTLVARLADRERIAILTRQPPGGWEYVLVDTSLPCATGRAGLLESVRRYENAPNYGLVYSSGNVGLWRRGSADIAVLPAGWDGLRSAPSDRRSAPQ